MTGRGEELQQLFAEVLDVADVGIEESFFDLGGDSLLAVRLVNRIRSVLGVEASVPLLFEAPTVTALLDRLNSSEKSGSALAPTVRPDVIPLSFGQRRMWLHGRLDGSSTAYNIPVVLELSGELDHGALEGALNDLVARHESLRTIFPESGGNPHQRILVAEQARLPLLVRQVDEADLDCAVREIVEREFELETQLPLRAELLVRRPGDYVLVLLLHHIAGDGWSLGLLARDLSAAYRGRRTGAAADWPDLPVQYADYTLWQRQLLGAEDDPGSVLNRQLDYWQQRLTGIPDHLDLPTDRPRPAVASHEGGTVRVELPPELHRDLLSVARSSGASLFMVLQAGLAALLTRLGAGTDIPIGAPIAGRNDEALNNLVGFFVNTWVLRVDTGGAPSFNALIERVRRASLAAYAHQDAPFEYVVEKAKPRRSSSHHPLFQVALALQNTPRADFELPGLAVRPRTVGTRTSRTDLFFSLEERFDEHEDCGAPNGVEGSVEFSADLFDGGTVDALAARWVRLLTALVADPARSIAQPDLLTPSERRRLLVDWNNTARDVATATVPDLFQAQVAKSPDASAVVCGEDELTYAELNTRANVIAHWLIAHGAGPERSVAVMLERSTEMTAAMLGVLKSGAAYLPVDPGYPSQRIASIIEDARPAALIATGATADRLPDTPAPRLLLDQEHAGQQLTGYPSWGITDGDRISPLSVHNLAYIIFTSGSTGRPKGVMVPHAGIASLVREQRESLAFGPGSRVLQLASPCFDASLWDVFGALLCGGTLVLAPAGNVLGKNLSAFISENRLTHVTLPPAVLAGMSPNDVPAGITLCVTGEVCTPRLVADWAPGRRMFNGYGPTEVTVAATLFECRPQEIRDTVPIGSPMCNKRVYVLDDRLQLVPPGVTGELYLSGAGLARGYLNRPDVTAARFLPDPFGATGEWMYRTGDLARWNTRGELEYLARTDDQVKIRGFRIEPGEVQSVLASHPDVRQAAVVVRENPPGNRHLVAYAVTETRGAGEERLRDFLAQHLPRYMVPSQVVTIDRMPLTPHGKVDRAALPAPGHGPVSGKPPRTPQQEVLCELFGEVLGRPAIGTDDDFFELGGHSLLAARLADRISEVLGIELPVQALFNATTVTKLDRRISGGGEDDAFSPLLPLRPRGRNAPVFCMPPVSGLSWTYAGLLRHLSPEFPVYGLQSRGLSDQGDLPRSFEDVIEDCVSHVTQVHPQGPCYLLGWSFGGTLAQAVAARLQQQGREVALLALLDASPAEPKTGSPPHRTPAEEKSLLYSQMLEIFGIDAPEHLREPLTREEFIRIARAESSILSNLEEKHATAITDVMRTNRLLIAGFRQERVAVDTLLFVAARESRRTLTADTWRSYIDGEIQVHEVACEHIGMTSPDSLRVIGPILEKKLRHLAASA